MLVMILMIQMNKDEQRKAFKFEFDYLEAYINFLIFSGQKPFAIIN